MTRKCERCVACMHGGGQLCILFHFGEQKEQLILLMEEDRWSELLTLGGEWNDQMRLFSTQYNQVEKSFSRGLVTKLSCENSLKSIQQQVEDLIKK